MREEMKKPVRRQAGSELMDYSFIVFNISLPVH